MVVRAILAVALLSAPAAANVNMVTPEGRVVSVREADEAQAIAQGYKVETVEQNATRLANEVNQETPWALYGGVLVVAALIAVFGVRYARRNIEGG